MKCRCGYLFAKDWDRDFDSACLVVRNGDYRDFLLAEMAAKKHPDKESEEHLRLVAEAAAYTGSMRECPTCHRYLLILPDKDEMIVLKRET